MKPYVDILGERYKVSIHKVSEDDYMKKNNLDGYCNTTSKEIVIADLKDLYSDWTDVERTKYLKRLVRHELLHAFLGESGLEESAYPSPESWAKNEEMVDWFAIQFPKILEAYRWCECL